MKLQKFRQSVNLSVGEMAELLGITKSHYYKIEEGYKFPSYKVMKSFKEKFGDASIDEVFFE